MIAPKSVRHVRLFKNGRSQAVRIPREFELPGHEAILTQDARGRLILEPVANTKLLDLLNVWRGMNEIDSLPEIADLPPDPVSL